MKSRYEAPRMVQETAQVEFLISASTTGQNVYTDEILEIYGKKSV